MKSESEVNYMRLIDADKLCMHLADLQLNNAPDERDNEEVQKEMKSIYEFLDILIKMLDKQPTAYDVDRAVEQLRATLYSMSFDESQVEIAIDVVKAGGKNDNG